MIVIECTTFVNVNSGCGRIRGLNQVISNYRHLILKVILFKKNASSNWVMQIKQEQEIFLTTLGFFTPPLEVV